MKIEEIEARFEPLWNAAVKQGAGLEAQEKLTNNIRTAVNAQAQGLRTAEARISRLEAMLAQALQGVAQPAVRVQQYQPRMRTVNQMPSNVRMLPAQTPAPFVQTDDVSADEDYEYDDDESEAG